MNASKLLEVGLIIGAICTTWTMPLEAAADCVSAVAIEAPEPVARQLRARLQAGRLAGVNAEHCRGADVYLAGKAGAWKLRFTQGTSTIRRHVKSPELAAVWVESWLMPTTFVDTPGANAELRPSHDAGKEPSDTTNIDRANIDATNTNAAKTTDTATALGSVAAEASIGLTAALGSLWLGPELRSHVAVSRGWTFEPRVGLAYAVSNRPEQASRVLRFSTALNREFHPSRRVALTTGVDLGMSSLLWRDRRVAKHLSGPHFGTQFALRYEVTSRIAVVARLEASLMLADRVESLRKRAYFDENSDDSDRVDIVTTEQRFEPAWIGAAGLGVVIGLGAAK